MVEYNKIDTIFERDVNGTKKLIPGKFRSPTVEFLADNQWTWTEKIDGTNIRVHWDGHKVEFGGRTERAQIPAPLVNYLNETFGGVENEELFESRTSPPLLVSISSLLLEQELSRRPLTM